MAPPTPNPGRDAGPPIQKTFHLQTPIQRTGLFENLTHMGSVQDDTIAGDTIATTAVIVAIVDADVRRLSVNQRKDAL